MLRAIAQPVSLPHQAARVLALARLSFIPFFFFFLIFLNYESMITHLQETWKIQNKVTYSSDIYYNYFLSKLRFLVGVSSFILQHIYLSPTSCKGLTLAAILQLRNDCATQGPCTRSHHWHFRLAPFCLKFLYFNCICIEKGGPYRTQNFHKLY